MKTFFITIFILLTTFSYSDQVLESYIEYKISDCEYVLCHNPSYDEQVFNQGQKCAYEEILNFIKNF